MLRLCSENENFNWIFLEGTSNNNYSAFHIFVVVEKERMSTYNSFVVRYVRANLMPTDLEELMRNKS